MAKCQYPGCSKDVAPPLRKYCSKKHQRAVSNNYTRTNLPEKRMIDCLKCGNKFETDIYHRICPTCKRKDKRAYERKKYNLPFRLSNEPHTIDEIGETDD